MTDFSSLGLNQHTVKHLSKQNILNPTNIQTQVIPKIIACNKTHTIIQAGTGSGKTAAFALPVLSHLSENDHNVQALVIAPTRELAKQVSQAFVQFQPKRKLGVSLLIGGASFVEQMKSLKRKPAIVVGTPGRICDHINQKTLKLGKVKEMVLDEADKMLEMGFSEDIENIFKWAGSEKRMIWASATMSPDVDKMAKKHLPSFEHYSCNNHEARKDIEAYFIVADNKNRHTVLLDLLASYTDKRVIIFCNTKKEVESLDKTLHSKGLSVTYIHGDLPQRKREKMLELLKKQKRNILIATDVAARGIHIDHVELVVNFQSPKETDSYIHRIGRTGRAGHKGKAATFFFPDEKNILMTLEEASEQKMKPHDLSTQTFSLQQKSEGKKKFSKRKPSKPRFNQQRQERGRERFSDKKRTHGSSDEKTTFARKKENDDFVKNTRAYKNSEGKQDGSDPSQRFSKDRQSFTRKKHTNDFNRNSDQKKSRRDFNRDDKNFKKPERRKSLGERKNIIVVKNTKKKETVPA